MGDKRVAEARAERPVMDLDKMIELVNKGNKGSGKAELSSEAAKSIFHSVPKTRPRSRTVKQHRPVSNSKPGLPKNVTVNNTLPDLAKPRKQSISRNRRKSKPNVPDVTPGRRRRHSS